MAHLGGPVRLAHVGREVVVPSLAALLARAAVHLRPNRRPAHLAALLQRGLDECVQQLILRRLPNMLLPRSQGGRRAAVVRGGYWTDRSALGRQGALQLERVWPLAHLVESILADIDRERWLWHVLCLRFGAGKGRTVSLGGSQARAGCVHGAQRVLGGRSWLSKSCCRSCSAAASAPASRAVPRGFVVDAKELSTYA